MSHIHPLPFRIGRFPRRARPFAFAAYGAVLVPALALSACAAPPAQSAGRPLPAYAGRETELFDDIIEPGAVGLSLDAVSDPRSDRLLRERAQVGDATLRVRVTTVTAKEEESGTGYVLGMKTVEKLAGDFPPGDTFEVSVGRTNPSAGLLKGMGSTITGKTLVGFVRTFVRPDGDAELHFHLGPDSKAEIAAVNDAAALGRL